MALPSLDIVLPCYNPAAGWRQRVVEALGKIAAELVETDLCVILVNDGSTRGLPKAGGEELELERALHAAGIQFRYLAYAPNRGKGHALRTGMQTATSQVQIYTDVDFPYREHSLIGLYRMLAEGQADIVAGVRDEGYYTNVPAGRRRISRLLRWMLRTFLRLRLTDTQCGLKGFNATGRKLFLQTSIRRFLFDLEFIYLASNAKGIRLLPAPVELKPDVVFSKVNPRILLGEGLNFIRILLRRR
ncbi:MAG: glycosyltransferase family 2 protein [Bacteroidota bacterium]